MTSDDLWGVYYRALIMKTQNLDIALEAEFSIMLRSNIFGTTKNNNFRKFGNLILGGVRHPIVRKTSGAYYTP